MPTTQVGLQPLCSTLSNEPVLREMVEMFVEEMPGRVARMQNYFATRNWEALRRAAHQMRGVAGSYGFEPLVPLAAQLEITLTRRALIGDIDQALEALLEQCLRLSAGVPNGAAAE